MPISARAPQTGQSKHGVEPQGCSSTWVGNKLGPYGFLQKVAYFVVLWLQIAAGFAAGIAKSSSSAGTMETGSSTCTSYTRRIDSLHGLRPNRKSRVWSTHGN